MFPRKVRCKSNGLYQSLNELYQSLNFGLRFVILLKTREFAKTVSLFSSKHKLLLYCGFSKVVYLIVISHSSCDIFSLFNRTIYVLLIIHVSFFGFRSFFAFAGVQYVFFLLPQKMGVHFY